MVKSILDLLAYIILFSPVELPVPHNVSTGLYDALKRVACREELASLSEPWNFSFAHEVTCLRNRLSNMAGVPKISAAQLLPSLVTAKENQQFNRVHAAILSEWLSGGMDLWPWPLENEGLYEAWCRIEVAADERKSVYFRRLALKGLAEMLGWQAVLEGRWPPPVPVWRFRRIE